MVSSMDKECNVNGNITNMLIITEGAKTEPKLFRQLARVFTQFNKFDVYSYNTNIYDLYDYLQDYLSVDGEIEGDFLQILKERESSIEKKKLLSQNYSDILLVFDFDPHDHRYDFCKLMFLMHYFSESTENGKLYLNYPMVELFKHFSGLKDFNYIERKIDLKDIPCYKKIVAKESGIGNIGDLDRATFIMIISENLKKVNYINGKTITETDIEKLNDELLRVAIRQNKCVEDKEFCYVLHTGLFFLPQYSSNWKEL